jgi:hypothetical protein
LQGTPWVAAGNMANRSPVCADRSFRRCHRNRHRSGRSLSRGRRAGSQVAGEDGLRFGLGSQGGAVQDVGGATVDAIARGLGCDLLPELHLVGVVVAGAEHPAGVVVEVAAAF